MQASSWTASGRNNPPLGQEQTPYIYQNVFNGGGANGIPCTYVGQHQSQLQTRPVLQLIGNVKNGSHWSHQVLQVPTAPSTDSQAHFRGTASSLASRNQSVFDGRGGTISNNGVQWVPSSSWNSTQNGSIVPNLTESSVAGQNDTLHPVSTNPAFQPLNCGLLERVCDRRQGSTNSFFPYPTKQAAGKTYTRMTAPVNHCSGNGGSELVNNGQRNGPISTTFGSALTQSANLNYPMADMNNGVNVVQEVTSAQRLTNFGKEASPVRGEVSWGHGQGPPAVGSSVVQSSNANCQPSSVVTSRMNIQGSHSNGSTVAFNLVSVLQNRVDFMLRKIYGQERMRNGKSGTVQAGAAVTNQKIPTTPDLPPLTMNTNSSFANGNSNSNSIGFSNIPLVQPSSHPYDARQSHQNLPSNSSGGIIPHSFTYIQQQSDASPAVCLPPPPAPPQQKNISNSSQGSGVLRENVPHVYQNQELPCERLCQNKTRESYALARVNGQWSQGITNTEPVHSFCTTTNAPSTFAADPHNLKCSQSWPSNQAVQSCGQLLNGTNADPPAYQQGKEDRQRNHFTAEKNPPPSYALTMERNQMLEGKTTELDSSKHSGKRNYQNSSEDRSKCLNTDTSSPGCVRQLEYTKKQHNLSTSLMGMKAIAVVPPISQQSNTDQTIGIANEDKQYKIQTSFPNKSVGGNPESEPNNPCLSHNVKESTPTISAPGKSLCNVIPTVVETSDMVKAQLSIQQSAVLAETSAFSVGSSQLQPNTDKDKLPTKDTFDLSTVPVVFWTVDKLRELIAELEKDSTPPESKMEESPTPHIVKMFWVGCEQHLYNAVDANVEEAIFDTWRTCTEDENPVVFSEVLSSYSAKLAETCLILGPDVYVPNDPVCKALSLNLCERTDNVGEHHVNPMSPEVHVTERDNCGIKPDEMETCRVEEPGTDSLDVKLLQKQPQSERPSPLVDPLSLLQIKVLSPTEAKELCLFGSQPSENETVEDPETNVPKGSHDPETKAPKGSHDNESAMESYCCLSRWMEVTVGYEASSLCKCRVNSSREQQEVHKTVYKEGKMEEGLSTTTYLEKHCFPQAEPNCSPVRQTELMASESPIESDVKSNECAAPSNVIQNPLNSDVDVLVVNKESRPECGKGDDVCAEEPDELPVEESILELKTKLSAAADSGFKVERVNCNFEEVPVAPVINSEEPCSKRLFEQKLCGSESSKTDTKEVIFGEVAAIPKESTFEGMQLGDLQAKLTGTVSHSLRQRIFSKKKLSGRKKMQKSKSKQPFQKPLPQSFKTVQKETPSPPAIASIKTNVDCSHNSQQKTLIGTNKHKKDNLNVAKLHFGKQASENKVKIRRAERFQSLSVSSEGSIASLALYGSSPQKQKYMVVSSTQPDLKPRTSTTTGPPTTISLKLHSQKKKLLEEDNLLQGTAARQRVYSSWERSLVRQQSDFKSKVKPTKNGKGSHKLAKKPKASSEIARIREGASSSRVSSQEKASPVTPKKCEEYGKNTSMTSASKTVKTKDPGTLKRGMVQKKCQTSKKDEQLLCSKEKKRKISRKEGPIHTSKKPCKSVSSNSVGKSKYEMGNPALMPISMKEKVLEFKLLPTSFDFREPQETSVMKKPSEQLADSASSRRVEHTQTLKTTTWKLKSHWRYGPNKKDPAISDAPSRRVGKSHTTYEEYKKRYLAKAVK